MTPDMLERALQDTLAVLRREGLRNVGLHQDFDVLGSLVGPDDVVFLSGKRYVSGRQELIAMVMNTLLRAFGLPAGTVMAEVEDEANARLAHLDVEADRHEAVVMAEVDNA